jgi:hypothetical protein
MWIALEAGADPAAAGTESKSENANAANATALIAPLHFATIV